MSDSELASEPNTSSPGDAVPTRTGRPSQRVGSFDGTRGLMALLVVVWHSFLVISPAIVTWVVTHRHTSGAKWWAALDPGDFLVTAIVVFFVLSGIVLTLPVIRGGFSWRGYYASRLLRLYLPAWAALAFGTILILLIPRGYASPDTWLGGTNATHVGVGQVLWQATLLSQAPSIDNPLWSISWEVGFSIALPLFIFVARKTARVWLWMIVAAVLITAVGDALGNAAVMYLPSFLIGAIVAVKLDQVRAAAVVISSSRWHTLWWWLIWIVSAVCIWGYRVTDSMSLVKPFTLINHILTSTSLIGYMGFLFIAMGNRTAVRLLLSKVLQRLGRISYSLYLVHVPIIATLAFALPRSEWLVPLIGIPLSLVVAAIFARFIEWPAHGFVKAIGRRAALRAGTRSSARAATSLGNESSSG